MGWGLVIRFSHLVMVWARVRARFGVGVEFGLRHGFRDWVRVSVNILVRVYSLYIGYC